MRPPQPATPRATPLARLAQVVPGLRPVLPAGTPPPVLGLTHDSRAVRPGDLFAALPGRACHGAAYAGQAARAGAVAILTDPEGAVAAAATGLPLLVADRPAEVVGHVAAAVYGDPSTRLGVIGVTGTDGKTSTCWLAGAALTAAGTSTGVLGSVETRLDGVRLLAEPAQHRRTTPEAGDLQATLAMLVERGARAVALEASSHGLALGRLTGTRFAVGVFTNLGHEHLDHHGSQQEYFAAKALLFDPATTRTAVVNVDDPFGRRLAGQTRCDVVSVSAAGDARADWRAGDVRLLTGGSRFTVHGPGGERLSVALRVPGRFNVDNALAALAAVAALGVDPAAAAAGLGTMAGVPGRMQPVAPGLSRPGAAAGDVLGFLDYAHTPGALTAAIEAARSAARAVEPHAAREPRVVLVTGTGGGRDASKRVALGLAATAADAVVLTDDNPRHEDPEKIIAALLDGTRQAPPGRRPPVLVERDRAHAVEVAVGLAEPGDVVLVAGKGPDRIQLVGDAVLPVDDEAALAAALAARAARPLPVG